MLNIIKILKGLYFICTSLRIKLKENPIQVCLLFQFKNLYWMPFNVMGIHTTKLQGYSKRLK